MHELIIRCSSKETVQGIHTCAVSTLTARGSLKDPKLLIVVANREVHKASRFKIGLNRYKDKFKLQIDHTIRYHQRILTYIKNELIIAGQF
jgi:hypothetical protein